MSEWVSEWMNKVDEGGKNLLLAGYYVLVNLFYLLFITAVYTVNIPEDASIGTTILTPVSTDRDASSNKELSFAITKGNNQVILSCVWYAWYTIHPYPHMIERFSIKHPKVNCVWFGSALLRTVIGQKKLALLFNQPMKSKTCTRAFYGALHRLHVTVLSWDRVIAPFRSIFIGCSNRFGFGFTTLIWKLLDVAFHVEINFAFVPEEGCLVNLVPRSSLLTAHAWRIEWVLKHRSGF